MTVKKEILIDMMIDEVLRQWPVTIGCVLRFEMLCIGCPIATFHSVADICREHGIDEDLFLACLVETIG